MPRTTRSATFSALLGRQLRARRLSMSLSQAEVARRLTVSTTYVQNVEAGRSNLTVGQLARICEALDAFPRFEFVSLESDFDGPFPMLNEPSQAPEELAPTTESRPLSLPV